MYLNSRPLVRRDREIMEHSSNDEEPELTEDSVDDVLRKYCIIREDRLPRYRHIFDKHIMLREMRIRERAMKAQRIRKSSSELQMDTSLDDNYGRAYEELEKYEFLSETLWDKLKETEIEIKTAKDSLQRSKALTARELLFKNAKLLKKIRKSNRRRPVTSYHEMLGDTSEQEKVLADDIESEMGSTQQKTYDYDKSARIGFQVAASPSPTILQDDHGIVRQRTPRRPDIPLQEFSDAEILRRLNLKTRKQIKRDSVVKFNASVVISLEEKLNRLNARYNKMKVLLEEQRKAVDKEKRINVSRREKHQHFVRQQSAMFQALHPAEDPVLDLDDVPEALRDVNGEISRADSGVIFEALDFPRPGNGVNFRTFCILAALSESAVSIQPLVRRLARKKDARALNVKMDKCKEIYGRLLGPNLDSLESELRSSGFTPAEYYQVIKKLSRDEGGLSFLNFVTYVPLFLDIHQRIVSDPLNA